MALLITVLGSCLVAASAAVAADLPANPAGHRRGGPIHQPPRRPPRGPRPRTTGPLWRPAQGPVPRKSHRRAARDSRLNLPPTRRACGTHLLCPPNSRTIPRLPIEAPAEKAKARASAPGAAVRPLSPPPQLAATASTTATSAPAASAHGFLPTAASSPQAVQGESASPLALGSRSDKNTPGKGSPLSAMITVGGALAIVLGLFLVIAWAMRKTAPRGSLLLPREVFEILGRAAGGAPAGATAPLRQQAAAGFDHAQRHRDLDRSHRSARGRSHRRHLSAGPPQERYDGLPPGLPAIGPQVRRALGTRQSRAGPSRGENAIDGRRNMPEKETRNRLELQDLGFRIVGRARHGDGLRCLC